MPTPAAASSGPSGSWGCQVPVNGAPPASAGNVSTAASEKHACEMLVAAPPPWCCQTSLEEASLRPRGCARTWPTACVAGASMRVPMGA
eukprot:2871038-Prymnesium_polylepis.1